MCENRGGSSVIGGSVPAPSFAFIAFIAAIACATPLIPARSYPPRLVASSSCPLGAALQLLKARHASQSGVS